MWIILLYHKINKKTITTHCPDIEGIIHNVILRKMAIFFIAVILSSIMFVYAVFKILFGII